MSDVWVCVATGSSLTLSDVEQLRGRARVLVINDAYRFAPWADAIYAADLKWWNLHYEEVRKNFQGRMFRVQNTNWQAYPTVWPRITDVRVFLQDKREAGEPLGLSEDPRRLQLGGLSGYQGIGVLKHWAAKVVGLLGFDMQHTDGKAHFFGDHPRELHQCGDYTKRTKHFETMNPGQYGMRVYQLTRQTALNCFPPMDLEKFLERFCAN